MEQYRGRAYAQLRLHSLVDAELVGAPARGGSRAVRRAGHCSADLMPRRAGRRRLPCAAWVTAASAGTGGTHGGAERGRGRARGPPSLVFPREAELPAAPPRVPGGTCGRAAPGLGWRRCPDLGPPTGSCVHPSYRAAGWAQPWGRGGRTRAALPLLLQLRDWASGSPSHPRGAAGGTSATLSPRPVLPCLQAQGQSTVPQPGPGGAPTAVPPAEVVTRKCAQPCWASACVSQGHVVAVQTGERQPCRPRGPSSVQTATPPSCTRAPGNPGARGLRKEVLLCPQMRRPFDLPLQPLVRSGSPRHQPPVLPAPPQEEGGTENRLAGPFLQGQPSARSPDGTPQPCTADPPSPTATHPRLEAHVGSAVRSRAAHSLGTVSPASCRGLSRCRGSLGCRTARPRPVPLLAWAGQR